MRPRCPYSSFFKYKACVPHTMVKENEEETYGESKTGKQLKPGP